MKKIHDSIRHQYCDAITEICINSGCKLDIGQFNPSHITVIHCDKYKEIYSNKENICDFIIFVTNRFIHIAVVEMKTGNIHSRKCIKQLEDGIKTVYEILNSIENIKTNYLFYPILLHRGHFHPAEYKLMRTQYLRFQGKKYHVILERCGSKLHEIFGQYPIEKVSLN